MARTSIDVSDRDYLLSHMQAPRGRGSWAFRIADCSLPFIWTPSMTYSDAKVWAKAKVRSMQADGTIPADVSDITLIAQP